MHVQTRSCVSSLPRVSALCPSFRYNHRVFALSSTRKFMDTTASMEASSSTAPAVSSSSRQKRPREPSPDNPPSSSKKLRTRKSTKHKKKKKRLDQYKLTRKDVPDNAKALEVSVINWFLSFWLFNLSFCRALFSYMSEYSGNRWTRRFHPLLPPSIWSISFVLAFLLQKKFKMF